MTTIPNDKKSASQADFCRKWSSEKTLIRRFLGNRLSKQFFEIENFYRFTVEEQQWLISLLPAVDRVDPAEVRRSIGILKNSYLSSAIDEFDKTIRPTTKDRSGKAEVLTQQLVRTEAKPRTRGKPAKPRTKSNLAKPRKENADNVNECESKATPFENTKSSPNGRSKAADQKSAKNEKTTEPIDPIPLVTPPADAVDSPASVNGPSELSSSLDFEPNEDDEYYIPKYNRPVNTGLKQCFVDLTPLPRMLIDTANKKLAIVVEGEEVQWRTFHEPQSNSPTTPTAAPIFELSTA